MAKIFECPKCGIDIGDSYQGEESDVGISAGYYCDACDKAFGDEDGPESHDDDVMISGSGGAGNVRPCVCGVPYEMGYGLAGGGIGPYSYCPSCGTIGHKSQDPT